MIHCYLDCNDLFSYAVGWVGCVGWLQLLPAFTCCVGAIGGSVWWDCGGILWLLLRLSWGLLGVYTFNWLLWLYWTVIAFLPFMPVFLPFVTIVLVMGLLALYIALEFNY